MRLAVLAALLCACSFTPGQLRDLNPADDAGGDATNATDAALDSPPLQTTHTRPITIGTVDGGPHTNFPVLVSLTATWLRPVSQGGDVASTVGHDIVFTSDAVGLTRLSHEVEVYSFNASDGRLLTWVEIPSLVTGTVIYMHYGDAGIASSQEDVAGVWSADFAAVWHLGNLLDSAAVADGTTSSSTTVSGKIGDAYSFDGADDEIGFGSPAAIDDVFAGGGTVEAWFFADNFGENARGRIFAKEAFTTGSGLTGWTVHMYNGNVANCVRLMHSDTNGLYGTWASPANSVTTGSWHHVAIAYNRDSVNNIPSIYLDGAVVAVIEETPVGAMEADDSHSLRLGNREALDRSFDGSIDEARLSTVMRSAGWIATSYLNQNGPDAFVTVGAEL